MRGPRFHLSWIAGLIGLIFGGYFSLVDRHTNTEGEIAYVRAEIESLFQQRKIDPSELIFLTPTPNPDESDMVTMTESEFNRIVLAIPWDKIQNAARSLRYHNSQIVEAQAMLRMPDEQPGGTGFIEPWHSYNWPHRHELAAKPLAIDTWFDRIKNFLLWAAIFGITASLTTAIALFLVALTWYFLLARLREISRAIRGD